jgi:hypothetical protein
MKSVTYGGSTDRSPLIANESYELEVGDKTYVFPEGEPVDVPDDVVKALGKPEGHNFDVATSKGE